MGHVFISYSSKDSRLAEEVCRYLEKKQIICWMAPRNIESGCDYMDSIPKAIAQCDHFLLVMTHNAQNSKWVQNEVGEAISKGKDVIPFVTEEFEISDKFAFLLRSTHWEYGIDNWLVALDRIVVTIRNTKVKQSGRVSEAPEQKKQELPRIKKTECPICGSTRIIEKDKLQSASETAHGMKLLAGLIMNVWFYFTLILLAVAVLCKFSETRDYTLRVISWIPVFGRFLMAGKSVAARLWGLFGIATAVVTAVAVVGGWTHNWYTSCYRTILEAKKHQVKCTCMECKHQFQKIYTPDEARIRAEQNTNDKNGWRAVINLVFSVAAIPFWWLVLRKNRWKTVLGAVLLIAVVGAIIFSAGTYIYCRIQAKKAQDKQKAAKEPQKEAATNRRDYSQERIAKDFIENAFEDFWKSMKS